MEGNYSYTSFLSFTVMCFVINNNQYLASQQPDLDIYSKNTRPFIILSNPLFMTSRNISINEFHLDY